MIETYCPSPFQTAGMELLRDERHAVDSRVSIGRVVGIDYGFIHTGLFDFPGSGELAGSAGIAQRQNTHGLAIPLQQRGYFDLVRIPQTRGSDGTASHHDDVGIDPH